MREVLYIDVYFFLNFIMDLVALGVTSLITAEKARLFRLLLASFVGSAFSVLFLFLPGPPWIRFAFGMLVFVPMIFLAFGKKPFRRFFFVCLFAYLTSLFLGGAVQSISSYVSDGGARVSFAIFLAVLCLAFGAWSLWGKSLRRRLDTAVVSLSIFMEEREEVFFGLVDSGSFLREPESGDPVILLKAEFAGSLLPGEILDPLMQGQEVPEAGLIPIPLRTASGTGRLLAFRPRAVRFYLKGRGKKQKEVAQVLVALDFSGGGFAGCPCLIPLSIL